ncbi:winged helix-turn-helix domain-containing protein [Sphaerotilus sp.]|uniref:winged helix-turn-helix domain-containing protein n=1 Tax=Sphaerotilus sp. TaxID=2093942 RepID=UPI00286DA368|nr:winged helix-turn-helix domain-containing protein [Sphaerotilus sp.]
MPVDRYRFGVFDVDCSRACLHRAGTEIALRPKSFALLHYLVTHPERLVTKDELLAAVWPGVVVTEDSLTRCISEIRAALGDGDQQMIRTITRRGYLFALSVQASDPKASTAPPPDGEHHNPVAVATAGRKGLPVQGLVRSVAALLLALVLVLSAIFWVDRGRSLAAPRLSLVVLPFAHLGPDPTREYLADAITNDLTTALAHIRGALVIAPGSAFTLKGAEADPRQVGTQFGVRYALQGSVLDSGEQLRISARLVDTQTSTVLWSDQFDTPRTGLLHTQDRIVTRLAGALNAELVQADGRRPKPAHTDFDAEDLALQCEAAWFRLGAQADARRRSGAVAAPRGGGGP